MFHTMFYSQQDTPVTTTSTLKYSPPTVSNVAFNAGTIASPPWLQEATPNSNTATPTETTPTTSAATNEIPRMILYTRVINLALSVLIIIVSLLSLAQTQSATTGVLASYLIVFACLLCCFETHLKQISKVIAINFGFMYSAKARSAFMLFIGKWYKMCLLLLLMMMIMMMMMMMINSVDSYRQQIHIM